GPHAFAWPVPRGEGDAGPGRRPGWPGGADGSGAKQPRVPAVRIDDVDLAARVAIADGCARICDLRAVGGPGQLRRVPAAESADHRVRSGSCEGVAET